jgi:predicted amino acid-binding ACT domain protein
LRKIEKRSETRSRARFFGKPTAQLWALTSERCAFAFALPLRTLPLMTQHAILTAVGDDRPGLVDDVTRFIFERGGNIEDSRMVNLRGQFAMMVLIGGTRCATSSRSWRSRRSSTPSFVPPPPRVPRRPTRCRTS